MGSGVIHPPPSASVSPNIYEAPTPYLPNTANNVGTSVMFRTHTTADGPLRPLGTADVGKKPSLAMAPPI